MTDQTQQMKEIQSTGDKKKAKRKKFIDVDLDTEDVEERTASTEISSLTRQKGRKRHKGKK